MNGTMNRLFNPLFGSSMCRPAGSALLGAILFLMAIPVFAGPPPASNMLQENRDCASGTIRMRPGMATHALELTIRGQVSCDSVTGRNCNGALTRDPICLDVTDSMGAELRISDRGTDTLLALVGPTGVRIDDDREIRGDALIYTNMIPGRYYLYPGVQRTRAPVPVTVTVGVAPSSAQLPPVVSRPVLSTEDRLSSSCPVGSEIVVFRNRDSVSLSGLASGQIDSSERMGQATPGWIPPSAQICVVIQEAGRYSFEITESGTDTVMAMLPGGNLKRPAQFDDDGGSGTLSRVNTVLQPGVYLLYVGTYRHGERSPFQMVADRR